MPSSASSMSADSAAFSPGGMTQFEPIEFDLLGAIAPAVEFGARRGTRKGLRSAFFMDPRLPMAVKGDPGRLRQVLVNLVSNAFKFTNAGHVVVRVTLANESASHLTIQFAVSDTGIGIRDEQRKKVLPLDSQFDESTKPSGLTICRQLCDVMGGQIWFESDEGGGSTFFFSVPVQKTAWGGPRVLPCPVRRFRVLVADSYLTTREILREQIAAWGLHVDSAVDRQTTLLKLNCELQAGTPFDVAVLDSNLGDSDVDDVAKQIKATPKLDRTCVLKLVPIGKHLDFAALPSSGFNDYLLSPIFQPYLINALVACAIGTMPGKLFRPTPRDDYPPQSQRKPTRASVLLVEDNEFNRNEMLAMLTRAGYECDVAGDGEQALAACQDADYDLVLMDCQMPRMDGFEAARRIRAAQGQRRDVPIIALTANALEGDRERCLRAGMSDYLSKPIDPRQLLATMSRWLDPSSTPPTATGVSQVAAEVPVSTQSTTQSSSSVLPFDEEELLERCIDDPEIVRRVLHKFEAHFIEEFERLRLAVAASKTDDIQERAHSLKGAAATVSAKRLADALRRLEELSRHNDLQSAPSQLQIIEAAWNEFRNYLATRGYCKSNLSEHGADDAKHDPSSLCCS